MRRLILTLLLISLAWGCSSMQKEQKQHSATAPSQKSVESQIRNKLKSDPLTAPWEINPVIDGNMITLTGLVDQETERSRAQELVRSVVGELRTVNNQIMLTQEIVLDAAMTAKLKTELVTNPLTRLGLIDVQIRKGVVKLTGSVKSDEQKREAEKLARGTAGVTNVENNLTIKG